MNDELPEWNWPYFDNYTGPYWSDGKFQASVSQGKKAPTTRLDRLSKRHDESYATARSSSDLDRADQVYYESSREMSLIPAFIGTLPKFNFGPRKFLDFVQGASEKNMGNSASYGQEGRDAMARGENLNRIRDAAESVAAATVYAPVTVNLRGQPKIVPMPENTSEYNPVFTKIGGLFDTGESDFGPMLGGPTLGNVRPKRNTFVGGFFSSKKRKHK